MDSKTDKPSIDEVKKQLEKVQQSREKVQRLMLEVRQAIRNPDDDSRFSPYFRERY